MSVAIDSRRGLIAKIHVAKKQLALDEDIYRQILVGVTGKDSCAQMTGTELEQVLSHLRSKGFRDGAAKSGKGRSLSPASRNLSNKKPRHKAVALWIELAKAGKIQDSSHEALGAFVVRMLGKGLTVLPGVDPLDAATPRQLHNVIEALKNWLERGSDRGLAPVPPAGDGCVPRTPSRKDDA